MGHSILKQSWKIDDNFCARNFTRLELKMFGLGEAPKGYNPKVHGPYDPSVYYGPKDTTFLNTKLGQLPGWLLRRPKNPIDWFRATNRSWWRWRNAYLLPRYANGSGVF